MNYQKSLLVAAPTHICKHYAFDEYIAAYRKIDYLTRRLLLVDNSPPESMYTEILFEAGVEQVETCEPGENIMYTVDNAWDVILRIAHEDGWDYVLSLESDVIVAPEGPRLMVDALERYNASMVRHAYPIRGAKTADRTYKALGCTLLRTAHFPEGCNHRHTGDTWEHSETALIKHALGTGWPVVEFNHLFPVKHLSEDGEIHERNTTIPVMMIRPDGVGID